MSAAASQTAGSGQSAGQGWPITPLFDIGDAVVIDDREGLGHCRAPFYLRGLAGNIAHIHGAFRDPERLAYHQPGLPARVLYKVRLRQSDIWPDYAGAANDTLDVDIYENWLRDGA
ncbi:MAG: SH3-like domain-containing protein [Pseudomonadota bacterium]